MSQHHAVVFARDIDHPVGFTGALQPMQRYTLRPVLEGHLDHFLVMESALKTLLFLHRQTITANIAVVMLEAAFQKSEWIVAGQVGHCRVVVRRIIGRDPRKGNEACR